MDQAPVPGERTCGGCTLCCKLLGIGALAKPAGQLCGHCALGQGCTIYEQRPAECRAFTCGYLAWPLAGEHWYPARSGMVLSSMLGGARLAIHVDSDRPDVWRAAPYYAEIKQWAARAIAERRHVVVHVEGRTIVILPDRDLDLGVVAPDEQIAFRESTGPAGTRIDAFKVKAGDPLPSTAGS